jgi:hypothetical protein
LAFGFSGALIATGFSDNSSTLGPRAAPAKLGEDKIDKVIEVLEGIATNPSVSRYALMVQPVEFRKMLTVGKVLGSEKSRRRVDRIVNILASKGVDLVIDLLG